jgi:hypothetical protein
MFNNPFCYLSFFIILVKYLCIIQFQELCGRGGVLFLARAILNLNVTPPFVDSFTVVAAISRLKAKVLSIVSFNVVARLRLRHYLV